MPHIAVRFIRSLSLGLAISAVGFFGAGCGSAPSTDGASDSTRDALLPVPSPSCGIVTRRTVLDAADVFEAALLAQGCGPMANYTTIEKTQTWFSVVCDDTPEVRTLIDAYATVPPYYAHDGATLGGIACQENDIAGKMIVSFDPNCPACM